MIRFITILIELWLPVLLVAIWWIGSGSNPSIYLPALSEVLEVFVKLWIFDHIRIDLVPSLINLAFGYGLALAIGISLGTVLGLSPRLSATIWPSLEFIRAIPGVALLPIFVIMLGVGPSMKISLIAVGAVWPILLNTVDGVRSVSPELRDVARSFRLPFHVRLFHIILPSAAPQIFSGARISLSIGVILIVVSEMVGANGGIGYFVRSAERSFAIPEMWSGIIMLGLVGYALNSLFRVVEAKVLSWHFALNANGRRS
ncbi:ABC transporter permease [Devosia sp. SL43]|uniref:ABC transporter permease n=1 Tax=Devosia sp. SL43 TaxID=2806348 RepID=UPI001F31BDC1|nr:ABC transporter permease [Devosia sp. SL43]UJW84984.1 ABC transporter permease [Devosia sp. SL43]